MNGSEPLTSSLTARRSSGPHISVSRQLPLAAITPRPRSRSFVVAGTRSGKSTMAAAMLQEYHRLYPRHLIYLLDPKKHFQPVERREGDTLLFPEGFKVRNFGRRDAVPTLATLLHKPRAPQEGEHCFLIQDESTIWDWCEWQYRHSSVKTPAMGYADESFDLASRQWRDPFRRLVQQGGGMGTGLTIVNQRPRNIDQTWISEVEQLYVSRLIKPDDRKHIRDAVTVPEAWPLFEKPLPKYTFLYLDQENERMQQFRLTGL